MSANSPSLSFVDKRGVWFRVLYDVLRTHSTFRASGIPLLYRGNRLGRLGLPDRLPFSKPKVNWLLHIMWTGHGVIPFLHDFCAKIQLFLQICNFFCKYAIFFAYLKQKSMIYGYIRKRLSIVSIQRFFWSKLGWT